MLFATPYHLLQVREREQRDEPHRVSPHHTKSRELILLIVVFRHHTEQRAIRHVDSSVHHHHKEIEQIDVYALEKISVFSGNLRRIEQEREDESKGNSPEDEPRTVGSKARLGAVSQTAHDGVSDYVKQTSNKHQCCSICKRKTKHVGEIQRKSDRHNLPSDTTGSRIAKGIANFFFK